LFVEVLEAGVYDHSMYNIYGHTVTVSELAALTAEKGKEETDIQVGSGSDPVLPSPLDDSRFRSEFEFELSYDADAAVQDYLNTLR
jgi:nucleoside-diphosphate-sugar epimerase